MLSPARTIDDSESTILKAVQGDSDALSQLLARFGPEVERSLKIGRRWRTILDTSDIMQVTYIEAFLQIGRFRPEQSQSFSAWLRRIAENNLRDAIRGLERQKQPPANRRIELAPTTDSFVNLYDALVAISTTPSRIAVKNDVQNLMEAAISRLPADYAQTIRLYDLQGQPIADVATALGRSPGAVHMLRARAHERLVELLGTASAWFESRA